MARFPSAGRAHGITHTRPVRVTGEHLQSANDDEELRRLARSFDPGLESESSEAEQQAQRMRETGEW